MLLLIAYFKGYRVRQITDSKKIHAMILQTPTNQGHGYPLDR